MSLSLRKSGSLIISLGVMVFSSSLFGLGAYAQTEGVPSAELIEEASRGPMVLSREPVETQPILCSNGTWDQIEKCCALGGLCLDEQ